MECAHRVIGFADLREAASEVAIVNVSDEELAERGVPLADEDTLLDGLGPSRYAVVELRTGEQYVLQRLLQAPFDGVLVSATLTDDPTVLTDRLLRALDIPYDRPSWRIDPKAWEPMLDEYRGGRRAEWLWRRGGSGE